MKKLLKFLTAPAVLLLAVGCSGGDDDDDDGDLVYVQIERLGRPGINEALIITPAYLDAFNQIPPSADMSADAAPVRTEAVATLDAIDLLDGVDDVDAGVIAGLFLPDVMRIDTAIAVATSASSFTAGYPSILRGGRKIEDDVIDVYYSVLTGTAGLGDNVRYQGYPGLNAAQPGHKMLHGAGSYNSAATFPFLASPN
jgi:hypothetical protein